MMGMSLGRGAAAWTCASLAGMLLAGVSSEALAAPKAKKAAAGPYGAGSHDKLDDGSEPDGFPVKGNESSKLYHVPGSSHYARTNAEVWFASEEAAEAAGFAKPASQQESDS